MENEVLYLKRDQVKVLDSSLGRLHCQHSPMVYLYTGRAKFLCLSPSAQVLMGEPTHVIMLLNGPDAYLVPVPADWSGACRLRETRQSAKGRIVAKAASWIMVLCQLWNIQADESGVTSMPLNRSVSIELEGVRLTGWYLNAGKRAFRPRRSRKGGER